ncbi:MAG: hypothetical protein WBA74_04400 [Cyclobacteriaceae bacterium]
MKKIFITLTLLSVTVVLFSLFSSFKPIPDQAHLLQDNRIPGLSVEDFQSMKFSPVSYEERNQSRSEIILEEVEISLF